MENRPARKRFSTRAFTSLLLTCVLLVMGFSGVMLYFSPRGRVANWTDWTLAGLGKEQWSAVHVNSCLLFLIVSVVHLLLNWRPFWGYVKKKPSFGLNRKWELALALALGAGVVVGTLYGIPPFGTIVAWQHEIKDYWEVRSAPAPVPHSEELTLAQFAGQIDLSAEEVSQALRREGYRVEDATITMAQLAHRRGVAPSDVFADVQKHFPDAADQPEASAGTATSPDACQGQGPGFGRGLGLGPGRGQGLGRGLGRGGGGGFGRGFGQGWAEENSERPDAAETPQ